MEVLDLFSVQASMCIYIRRPPLVGGHQAAKDFVAITVFQSWFLSSLQLPVCQSGILSNVSKLVLAVSTPGTDLSPSPDRVTSSWC